jgi:hypothetical protein
VLAEQHDDWTEMRRYIGLDVLARCRQAPAAPEKAEEVTLTALTTQSPAESHAELPSNILRLEDWRSLSGGLMRCSAPQAHDSTSPRIGPGAGAGTVSCQRL